MKKRYKYIVLLIFGASVLWNVYINQTIVMHTHTYTSPDLPEAFSGYRIVQLTDIHSVRDEKQGDLIYQKVVSADPDMICITGDLVDSGYYGENGVEGEAHTLRLLEKITALAPVYWVYGNHEMILLDNPEKNAFRVAAEDLGVKLINNKTFKIYASDRESYIRVAGIQDPATLYKNHRYAFIKTNGAKVEAMLDTVTMGVRNEEFVLLLSHRPEYMEMYDQYPVDVCLTGHAHGGQFRIPFIGGVYAPGQGFFPKYTAGEYTTADLAMYVGTGIGNSTIPVRVFNPPEIITVVLERE